LDGVPVRFNLLEVNGATVILDYGHNVASLTRLIEALEHFPQLRRSVVYSAAGDRRDGDLIRQGELLADAFDRVILYEEEHCIRGRPQGQITGLFRQGLATGSRVSEIEEVQGAVKAVEVALNTLQPGELLLAQVDLVEETITFVRQYIAARGTGREIDLDEARAICQPTVETGAEVEAMSAV
jgi:cyanophycin synthetase